MYVSLFVQTMRIAPPGTLYLAYSEFRWRRFLFCLVLSFFTECRRVLYCGFARVCMILIVRSTSRWGHFKVFQRPTGENIDAKSKGGQTEVYRVGVHNGSAEIFQA